MNETWKRVIGYDNYEVSDKGNVRRIGASCNLAFDPNSQGYKRVRLSRNGKTHREFVHRLVAAAFIDKPDGCDVVNHIDCNVTNNQASNLEWCTVDWNMRWMVLNGREGNKSRPVRGTNIVTGESIEFESTQAAQREGGFWSVHVSSCCRGKLKQHHGYKFEYING